MAHSTALDSYFTETIVDDKGVSVCDMNAGINELFKYFNENFDSFELAQRYFVPEQEEGYPDLIASKCAYGSQNLWWWVLMLNRLDDSFEGIKKNWVYSIVQPEQIGEFIQNSTAATEASTDDRIGSVIELN